VASPENFDLVVIGSGPGGYVCAIRAAQLGLKVALIEKRSTLGGTCLNIGCIPSKALLHATERFAEVSHSFPDMGIQVSKPKIDMSQLLKFKEGVIEANVKGVAFLMKKNGITVFYGTASIASPGVVHIKGDGSKTTSVQGASIAIATGSEASSLPNVMFDGKNIISSTEALELSEPPKTLIVIGAGVIGLELGSVWARLGTQVTCIEYQPRILPGMDKECADGLQRILEKQGMVFHLNHQVMGVKSLPKGGVEVLIKDSSGKEQQVKAALALVSVGRRPYTRDLGLEGLGIHLTPRGFIPVNERFETSVSGIYAFGDVIEGPMLAHKASEEGVACAEILAGKAGHVNYHTIPGVVYTSPEFASVGFTEDTLKETGHPYTVARFPFTANGRAKAAHNTNGFVKILADAETDRILGVHIVSEGASEMIHEAVVAMELGGSAEDLARTCHAHPTRSEAIKEAALGIEKRTLHM
jgi:dihydrolipoamide dehydrogenase